MDVEENEGIFQKFAEMEEKNDDDDEAAEDEEEANSDSDDDTDDDDDDESSVELDADALNKMLLGSDDEGDRVGAHIVSPERRPGRHASPPWSLVRQARETLGDCPFR